MARSECAGCGLVFNSTAAFDRHRTGEFEVIENLPKGKKRHRSNRRCMSVEEMLAMGMSQNARGLWIIAAYDPTITYAEDEAEAAD